MRDINETKKDNGIINIDDDSMNYLYNILSQTIQVHMIDEKIDLEMLSKKIGLSSFFLKKLIECKAYISVKDAFEIYCIVTEK